jgi:hypothetical protein
MKVTVIAAGFDAERAVPRRPLVGLEEPASTERRTTLTEPDESPDPEDDDDLEIPGFVRG